MQGESEQQVAQPVRPLEDLRAQGGLPVQPPKAAFGPASERPADVELGPGPRAAGQDERVQRLEPGRVAVDVQFEAANVSFLDPVLGRRAARRDGELALGDVDLVLEANEQRAQRGRRRWEERLR